MPENTLERLLHLVAEEMDLGVGRGDIDPDVPLLEAGLNLDSLAVVELITLSEEEFGIDFGEEDLTIESFASLRALAGVIDSRLAFGPSKRGSVAV